MQIAGFVIAIVSALIASLSAWIAWRATRPIPEIIAKITTVIATKSQVSYSQEFNDTLTDSSEENIYYVHVQMTNLSVQPVQLINYEFEVVTATGRTLTMFKPWSVSGTLPFTIDDQPLLATFDRESFLNWPPRAVGYGELQMGFLIFNDKGIIRNELVEKYRLRLYDVFGRVYTATSTPEQFEQWMSSQEHQSMNLLALLDYAKVNVRIDDRQA